MNVLAINKNVCLQTTLSINTCLMFKCKLSSYSDLYRWVINMIHISLPKIPTDIIAFEIMEFAGFHMPVLRRYNIVYNKTILKQKKKRLHLFE